MAGGRGRPAQLGRPGRGPGPGLDEARARAGAERLAEVDGVVGTLLELVEVDDGWETAFEAAVGEAVTASVVDGVDAARRAFEHLRSLEAAAGAVLALPETTDAGAPASVGGRRAGQPTPCAATCGPGSAGVASLLDRLLPPRSRSSGDWARGPRRGHPASRPGRGDHGRRPLRARRPGAPAPPARVPPGPPSRRPRPRPRRPRMPAAERAGQVAGAKDELAAARGRAEASLGPPGDSNRSALTAAGDALAPDRRPSSGMPQPSTTARPPTGSSWPTGWRRDERRVAELEGLLPALEEAAAAEAERAAGRAVRTGPPGRAGDGRRRPPPRPGGPGGGPRGAARAMLTRRLAEVEERLRRHVAERAEAAARRAALEVEAAGHRAPGRPGGRAGRSSSTSIVDALRAARRRRRRRPARSTDRAGAAAPAAGERRTPAGRAARAGRRALELDEAEARVRLETLVETIRRDLDCEPDATREAPLPDAAAGHEPDRAGPGSSSASCASSGPSTPSPSRSTPPWRSATRFLEAQLDDVRAGRRELTKVIKAIDAEIVEVFRAAYADVVGELRAAVRHAVPRRSGAATADRTGRTCSRPASRSRPGHRGKTSGGCRCSRAASAASRPWPSSSPCSAAGRRPST